MLLLMSYTTISHTAASETDAIEKVFREHASEVNWSTILITFPPKIEDLPDIARLLEAKKGGRRPATFFLRDMKNGGLIESPSLGICPKADALIQATLTKRAGGKLHIAVLGKCFPLAKQLLELGMDPNAPNQDGQTPLHFSRFGTAEMLLLLIKHGANLTLKDFNGNTTLDLLDKGLSHYRPCRVLQ